MLLPIHAGAHGVERWDNELKYDHQRKPHGEILFLVM